MNGLFGVGKGEFVGALETQRLIMNQIPFNNLCEPLVGEVATLPSVASFQSFLRGSSTSKFRGRELLLLFVPGSSPLEEIPRIQPRSR